MKGPNAAAALCVAGVTVVPVVPALFVAAELVGEAAAAVRLAEEEARGGRWRAAVERHPRFRPAVEWVEQNVNLDAQAARLAGALADDAAAAVGGSAAAALQALLALYVLFYFPRDRDELLGRVRSWLPLSAAEADEVFGRARQTVEATIYGRLLTAAIQGALGGLMLWWLGLPAPLLWGVVMALLAVVPYLGAFVVWGPAAAYLALSGDWGDALRLTGWGAVVIGSLDNLLDPLLVGGRLRMHTLAACLAILAGVALLGAPGIILGPVVVAVTAALLEVWRRRAFRAGDGAEGDGRPSDPSPEH